MTKGSIAIIGSGISGLVCAYRLAKDFEITLYEANDYVGGHTRTLTVEVEKQQFQVDTGFIVFNDRTYPNFIALLKELQIPYQKTQMSFSVTNSQEGLEYSGTSLNTLFAQRRNLLRPSFWQMTREILRFNRKVKEAAAQQSGITLGSFLLQGGYSTMFCNNYLLPMVSAIWSMGISSCMDFPLDFFVRFFKNHGLLDLTDRPQWFTIKNGSSSYIKPLTKNFAENIRLSTRVLRISRDEQGVLVTSETDAQHYDQVVLACHGDQALAILDNPSKEEVAVLQHFTTSTNEVILHRDISLLPSRKLAWASWNYNMIDLAAQKTTLTYNMNILQNLPSEYPFLVSLNQEIAAEYRYASLSYNHPVYTLAATAAQKQWQKISGIDRIHFCGAYWHNGFHEDGVVSGLRVAKAIREGS